MSESTKTLTLTDFLLARIAEDEVSWRARFDPTRVRTECEAKRRIVSEAHRVAKETHQWVEFDDQRATGGLAGNLADTVLTQLALPYANHPDWREDWRP